jgi:Class III cytochrome C family
VRRRITFTSLVALALLLCPLPAAGGWLWDSGIASGYASLVVAATLYLYPLRGAGLPHKRLFTLSQHRRIGWIVLGLGLLHTALLLIAQPLVGHYLLPSAPLYMLLGLVALIVVAILVATGLTARTALRNPAARHSTPTSVTTHGVLAAALLALLGIHIVASGQLLDRPAKVVTVCLLLAIPLLWAGFRRRGVFLRIALPGCAAAAVLLLLPVPTATSHYLEPVTRPALLAVHFPHEKHTKVACVTCHHNFVDRTGLGSCIDCHRSNRADLTASSEATFHVFCRGCHTQLAQAHTDNAHGPTRACSECHFK